MQAFSVGAKARFDQPGLAAAPRMSARPFGRHRKRRLGAGVFGRRKGTFRSAGFSGRAAHVGAAFLVGIASDALEQAFSC
jgi:hypothetical protein